MLVFEDLFLVCENLRLIRKDLVKRLLILFDASLVVENRLLVFQNGCLVFRMVFWFETTS